MAVDGRRTVVPRALRSPSLYPFSGPDIAAHTAARGFAFFASGQKSKMPLIEIVVVLIVVGVLLWLINSYIPMAGPIKSLLNAVVVIALVVWILKVFGLWHQITSLHVGS
jgi:hypothetical protein